MEIFLGIIVLSISKWDLPLLCYNKNKGALNLFVYIFIASVKSLIINKSCTAFYWPSSWSPSPNKAAIASTSSALLSLQLHSLENITPHNSEFSDSTIPSTNSAISLPSLKDIKTELSKELPIKLDLSQSESTSPPQDATDIVTSLSELLIQSLQPKNSTEQLESYPQKNSSSSIMKREPSHIKSEIRSISD